MPSILGTAMQRTPCESNRIAVGCLSIPESVVGSRSFIAKHFRDPRTELDR